MSHPSKVPLWFRPLGELTILTAVQNAHMHTHSLALVTHTLLSRREPASSATVLCLLYTRTSRSFSAATCITSISCVTTSRMCGDTSAVCSGCCNTRCHFTPQMQYRKAYITVLYLAWAVRVLNLCKKKKKAQRRWNGKSVWVSTHSVSHFLQERFINNWDKGKKDQRQNFCLGYNVNFNRMTCMCVRRTIISSFADNVVAQWD